MIDGDDHEEDRRDPEDRTEEGAPPAEESRTDAGDTTVADSPVDAEGHDGSEPTPEPQGPAEEQPAMPPPITIAFALLGMDLFL